MASFTIDSFIGTHRGGSPGTISGTTESLHQAIVLEIVPGALLERVIVPEIVLGFLVD